jgi:hypothetical protein
MMIKGGYGGGMKMNNGSGAIYGIGFLGALVYFIQHATSFWLGVLGVLKAIFWPAMIVYKALELLKM